MKKIVFIIALIVFVSFGFFTFNKSKNKEVVSLVKKSFDFQEMTIPGLRNRSYQSSLSALEKYQDHPNYTSYLTSYISDGLKVNGLLTIPDSDPPAGGFPAIVFVHGYIAPGVYVTTERYQDYVDYLARNGFVVFKIDLRGHGDSEGEAGGSYYSEDYIVDTLNAYSALQSSDFVNKDKVGLWGHSMAGNVTFRSFVAKQNIPAVAIWAGAGFTYSDLQSYRLNDNSYRPPTQNTRRSEERQRLRNDYGDFDPNSWFWKLVTPINYLDGVTGSVALFHAENDSVVSVEYSKNLNNILDNTDIPHEIHLYSSGGHNLEGNTFSSAMSSTVEFFQKAFQLGSN